MSHAGTIIGIPGLEVIRVKRRRGIGVWAQTHTEVSNLFNLGRHLVRAEYYRILRTSAFTEWRRAVA
jgi:putative transposase